jgi:tryptophan synthase alpha subunit
LLKQLVIYLMAGAETPQLAAAAVEGGADIIELGFPFSDPLGEGPVIREASERALAEGMRTESCVDCLQRVRATVGPDVPLVPMTYAALLEAYGYEAFDEGARQAGASSLIIVDLPIEARTEIQRIRLIAPTSRDERIARAAELTEGWLYVVSVVGTTGLRDRVSPVLAGLTERARRLAGETPLYAGFGIATPEQARRTAELVDGVAIGSRAVQVAQEGPKALRDYVASIRRALDQTGAALTR